MKKKILTISAGIIFLIVFSSNSFSQQNVLSKDGVKINFSTEGKGKPALVFVHGWNCDKSFWNDQAKAFSPKYEVVTIDLAGYGESGSNRKNYTMQAFGADIAAVVNKLKLKRVILIGHSMGGAVIIEAALLLKGKVIGLVGADTFQDLRQTMSKKQADQFLKPFKENFVQATSGFVKAMFPPTADSMVVKRAVEKMSSAPPEIALSSITNLFIYNAVASLKNMHAPIVSINCDRYPIQTEENRKLVKSFEVKMMKGVGHFVMLEDPTKFNQLLQESIDELVK